MTNIPQRFPTVATDLAAASLRSIGEMMIQIELEFDRPLDVERLTQALTLALDAEPVLGCRFVAARRPYWERLPAADAARGLLTIVADAAQYEVFLTTPAIAADGPQLHACLWRTPAGERLTLKISHEMGDAGGAKDVAAIVADAYRRLRHDPQWRPEPNLLGTRGMTQVLRRLPWRAFPRIYWNYLRHSWQELFPLASLKLPWRADARGPLSFVLRHVPAARVANLSAYGRARHATLHDVFMTAFYRALTRVAPWDGRTMLRAGHTIDLRRYMPHKQAEAVCNLSGVEHHRLGRELGADFAATLDKFSAETRRRKDDWFGLDDYIGVTPLLGVLSWRRATRALANFFQWLTRHGGLEHALTNMGPIDPECVVFDERPRAAWLVVPPMYPPEFLVGLSGYAGSLTLSSGVYSEAGRPGLAEDFFDAMLEELPE